MRCNPTDERCSHGYIRSFPVHRDNRLGTGLGDRSRALEGNSGPLKEGIEQGSETA
jgi:hypothetical protein